MSYPSRETFATALYGLLLSIAFVSGTLADVSDFDRDIPRPEFNAVASKQDYDRPEQIRLTLTLSLDRHVWTKSQVTVATFEAGTISVVSIRNGKPIQPSISSVDFENHPRSMQIASLKTIARGDVVTIPFEGSRLVMRELNPDRNDIALVYPLTEPGLYTLRFRYHYTGPDGGKPNVFRGVLLSNPVSFRVKPGPKHSILYEDPPLVCDPTADDDWRRACEANLDALRSSSSCSTVIESLEQPSAHPVTIRPSPDGETTNQPQTMAAEMPGVGSGSDIYWDATSTKDLQPGVPRDPTASLCHEICHAKIADLGQRSFETEEGTDTRVDELLCTESENDYRVEQELCPRTIYGDADVSQPFMPIPPVSESCPGYGSVSPS
jgi:hypothetical protein